MTTSDAAGRLRATVRRNVHTRRTRLSASREDGEYKYYDMPPQHGWRSWLGMEPATLSSAGQRATNGASEASWSSSTLGLTNSEDYTSEVSGARLVQKPRQHRERKPSGPCPETNVASWEHPRDDS